ncbi:MAG: hypothetical protein KAX77_00795 [Xanthomonadales bacterium]|nr:hypothetical protein [Xanthomonadales bacterium]
MNHLTGPTITRLMQRNRKTIGGLARAMGITQARVRQVRARGVVGEHFVADWMEAITGNHRAGWDVVAAVYA